MLHLLENLPLTFQVMKKVKITQLSMIEKLKDIRFREKFSVAIYVVKTLSYNFYV